MKNQFTLMAVVASAAMLVLAVPAQAGPVHVDLNIGFGLPLPLLVQAQPVYVQPSPVYIQQRPYYGYRYGDYWAQQQRDERAWREHQWREHHEWHDHDREWHDHDYRDYRGYHHD